jgi:calcineurin-like phosphoesterase family protein
MKIWFTSDQHFGHANIIKYCNRPFESAEQMNEELVRRHNSLVGLEDIVYHLGDFSMSKAMVPIYLSRLNGKHILIAGNHDHCHPVHAKKAEKIQRLTKQYLDWGFSEVHLSIELMIGNQAVRLHHMPYHSDHAADISYKEMRPVNDGRWLLHGHIHEKWKQQDRMINVGVDVWNFYPVSLDEIMKLILASTQK